MTPRDFRTHSYRNVILTNYISQDDISITVGSKIPRGHKIATKPISKDDGIIKYGERMGHATADIKVGEHVHTHNVLGDRLSTEQVK